jgi:hypothetical protein
MKQEQNGGACCMDCGGNSCCHNDLHGGSNQLLLLRWLLGILIIVITFMIGFKLGELKEGAWGRGYMGMPTMKYRVTRPMNTNQYPPMMQFEDRVAPAR